MFIFLFLKNNKKNKIFIIKSNIVLVLMRVKIEINEFNLIWFKFLKIIYQKKIIKMKKKIPRF
jgi:hypothetical protein